MKKLTLNLIIVTTIIASHSVHSMNRDMVSFTDNLTWIKTTRDKKIVGLERNHVGQMKGVQLLLKDQIGKGNYTNPLIDEYGLEKEYTTVYNALKAIENDSFLQLYEEYSAEHIKNLTNKSIKQGKLLDLIKASGRIGVDIL